jgi:tetratricopeptide (TPR) repeat protein/biotin operon repressor
MRISRDELVLLGLDKLLNRMDTGEPYTKEDLAIALDISKKTLNEYLTKLKKAGLIVRIQRKFVRDLDSTISITEEGKKRISLIWDSIDKMVLTPEHHGIPSCINITSILDRFNDPLEMLFFLSLYSSRKDFDLIMFLDALKISKTESNIVNIFSDMDLDEGEISRIPFIVTFSKTSFHGHFEREILERDGWSEKDVNALLVIAESNQKQGRLNDALALYDFILSDRNRISQNQWFIARMGLVHTYRKKGEFETAIRLLDETDQNTDNKTYLAYSKQVKALILTIQGDFQEAKTLFKSSIRSFKTFGLPLMLSICYNNRGTLYYREGDFKNAGEDWKKARRYATEAKSEYCESAILANLADIQAMNGNFSLSLKYLDRAQSIIEGIGDYENLGAVEFNRSLIYAMMKNKKMAVKHFKSSLEIAYPLPSSLEREEWKNTLLNYSEKYQCSIEENEL